LEATTETSLIGTGVFQFHFGSIGSDCEKSWGKYKSEFQFHFGSIGSNDCINLAVIKSVSIPLWFDWKQIRKVLHLYRIRFNSTLVRLEVQISKLGQQIKVVSIPLWFDWKTCNTGNDPGCDSFQFHFGSIGSF